MSDEVVPPPVEEVCDRFGIDSNSPNDHWCVQTYIHLRRRGLKVSLISRYQPEQICVTSYEYLSIRDLPFHSYVVACRHDRGRPEICEQRIVQNHANRLDSTDCWLPHWPQPGLVPRDRSRGTRLERLAYKGRLRNLAAPFQEPAFDAQLDVLGIEFERSPAAATDYRLNWRDYSQADAILAIRNCTEYDLSLKPPSKLLNAWMAGTPALLGPEPAFQALRRSELDYIEIRSPQDAIAALKRLREEPELYAAMVDNGFRRAEEFSPDRISEQWRDLLAGPIAAGYERWRQQSPLFKVFGRPVQFVRRAIAHKRERQYFFKHIHSGPRLFPVENRE